MKTKWQALVALTLLLLSPFATAFDMHWNGFLSVYGGKTISHNRYNPLIFPADTTKFVADVPTRGQYGHEVTFRPDTLYGIQNQTEISDELAVTLQLTGAGAQDFDAKIRWAYLSYEFSPDWFVKLGRQRLPTYQYSDSLDVGYTYHWVRPPTSVYLAVFESYEGVSIHTSSFLWGWDTRLQAYYGYTQADNRFLQQDQYILDLSGISAFMAKEDWLMHATVGYGRSALDSGTDREGNSLDSESGGVASYYLGFSLRKNFHDSFIGGEIAYVHFDETFPYFQTLAGQTVPSQRFNALLGYYLTAGYAIGKFTPHLTYEYFRVDMDRMYEFIGGQPGSTYRRQRAVTLGVRWDFHSNAAFKVEYNALRDASDSDVLAFYDDFTTVSLLTMGIDLVF